MSGAPKGRKLGLVTGAAIALSACGADGLAVGNIASTGDVVQFKLANDGNNTGDVVLWIEQGDLIFCEHIAAIESRSTYTLRVACPQLRSGQFAVRAAWAYTARNRAIVAERIR